MVELRNSTLILTVVVVDMLAEMRSYAERAAALAITVIETLSALVSELEAISRDRTSNILKIANHSRCRLSACSASSLEA